MIKLIHPQPESDLTLNTMVLGADIIDTLNQSNSYVIIEDLLFKFLSKDKKRSPMLFFDALTVLYSLGIIKMDYYRVKLIKKRRKIGDLGKHFSPRRPQNEL